MGSGKAWYWLAVGILALGLNSEYQSGRLHWARQATDQSLALIERATDRTMHYVTLAEIMLGDNQAEFKPAQVAVALVQAKVACARVALAQREIERARPELMNARFEVANARIIAAAQERAGLVVCPHSQVQVRVPQVRVHVPQVKVTMPDPGVVDLPESFVVDVDSTF